MLWHTVSLESQHNDLRSGPERGLEAAEAAARFLKHGPNELPEAPPVSPRERGEG